MSAAANGQDQRWTVARVTLLREHHASGLTAAESARLLGDVSKNAVISKRYRLGLFGSRQRCEAAVAPGGASAHRRFRPAFFGPPPLPVEPLPEMDVAPPADAAPKPLAFRGFAQCAWPLGPAEEAGTYKTLFCCAPVRGGGSYCRLHASLGRRRR